MLAALAAVALALLAVPVDLGFEAHRRERTTARVTLRWLWGGVRLPLPEGNGKRRRARPGRRARKPRRPSGARRALAVLRSPGFPRRVVRLLGALRARVHVRRLALTARLGLDDPADTGRLWGMMGPVAALAALPATARVAITPEFTGARFELDARGEVRVVPAAILVTLVAFLLAPATLRAAFAAARA